jgi:hypothetical protein
MNKIIKAEESGEPAIESHAGATGPASSSKPAGQSAQQSIQIDDAKAQVCYANFCRVTGTPEELILDFGLNSQPSGTPTAAIEVKQRLIVNYFTAKRLLQALGLSVQRHEQAFGVLETDVQKRVMMLPRKAAQQAGANG